MLFLSLSPVECGEAENMCLDVFRMRTRDEYNADIIGDIPALFEKKNS